MRYVLPLAFALAVAMLAAPASAARRPTTAERAAIVRALPRFVRTIPARCMTLQIRVANNGRYALAEPRFRNLSSCIRYASNGFFVLRKRTTWRVIYTGSELPPCSLAVPRDLVGCRPG